MLEAVFDVTLPFWLTSTALEFDLCHNNPSLTTVMVQDELDK
jgi:hypothetical protein